MLHRRSLVVALAAGVALAAVAVLVTALLQASPPPLVHLGRWLVPASWQGQPLVAFVLNEVLWARLPLAALAYLFGALLVNNLQGRPGWLLLACALPWSAYVPMSLLGPHVQQPPLQLLGTAGAALLPVLLGLWLAGRKAARAHPPLSFRRPLLGVRRNA